MQKNKKKQKTSSEGMQITTKKQKFVGVKTLVDKDTGEEIPMQMEEIEDRDFNFHKVWLQNLITSLDTITNQKMKVAFWIIDHLDKENQLIMTQREIAKETTMSLQTVNKTIKALCEGKVPFLQKINNSGAYRVNPDVLYKGSHSNRMGIVLTYKQTDQKNAPADDETPAEEEERQEEAI